MPIGAIICASKKKFSKFRIMWIVSFKIQDQTILFLRIEINTCRIDKATITLFPFLFYALRHMKIVLEIQHI